MAEEATLSSLVERLHIENNRIEALEEIKQVISAIPQSELRNYVPNISILNVFQCLNSPDKNEQQISGEVLNRILSNLNGPVVLEHFNSQILAWLRIQDTSVQALCLPLLTRLSKESPQELCQYEEVVLAVIGLLCNDNHEVGPGAAAILTHMGRNSSGCEMLFSDLVVRHLNVAMQKNDVCRFRVYQIATDLSMTDPVTLESCVSSGLMQQIVNEMTRDDILVQLNVIELLSDLARSPHGLVFLDQHGVVTQLEQMMVGLDDNPMAGIILPGIIKFFGGLARSHPKEVCSRFDNFVRLVLSNISGGDPGLRAVSVDTIGFIAATPDGKLALEKLGNPMTECVGSIGSLIKSGTSGLRVRALSAMSDIVYLQEEHQTVELLSLTERWFCSSMSQPFSCVWSIAQQPFSDLRVPALHTLQSIALCPWGQKLMNNTPGFREYVLDRATETTKEGKDEKFALVKILAQSPTSTEIFGQPYLVKLKEHFNQGPYFVLPMSEVAMEGQ